MILILIRFLLVEFQLNYVLSRKEIREVEAALHALPMDMGGAYEEIFERASREGATKLIYKILSWVFYAPRPMLMDELREAILVKAGDTELPIEFLESPAFLVEECKSLINFDKQSGVVRFAHATVQEYLASEKMQHLLRPEALAKTLLTYISFDVFKLPAHREYDLTQKLDSHKLSRYAAQCWPEYTRRAGEQNPEIQNISESIWLPKSRRVIAANAVEQDWAPAGRHVTSLCCIP